MVSSRREKLRIDAREN